MNKGDLNAIYTHLSIAEDNWMDRLNEAMRLGNQKAIDKANAKVNELEHLKKAVRRVKLAMAFTHVDCIDEDSLVRDLLKD